MPLTTQSQRAGRYIKQPAGYSAFMPEPLPPSPQVSFDNEMLSLLSRADQCLGRLDGASRILPNPDLFVHMYVRREAVLSSQIEGTQSTIDDVLEFELGRSRRALPTDVEEVSNYVRAMNHGLKRLETLPLSLRLIREVHGELLRGVRGGDRQPGEFRTSQNWIGVEGALLRDAAYVPPPPVALMDALGAFEKFLHEPDGLPVLIHAALAHAQLETIHPFIDGNGRVGRLLITFQLCHAGVMEKPLLYLSYYLKRHRSEYYDRLTAVRESGDWEGWIKFFLRGISATADDATATAQAIVELREQHRRQVQEARGSQHAPRLLDLILEVPILTINLVSARLSISAATANKLVDQFEQLGLLNEITGGKRNRIYRYSPYLNLFRETSEDSDAAPAQATAAAMKEPIDDHS